MRVKIGCEFEHSWAGDLKATWQVIERVDKNLWKCEVVESSLIDNFSCKMKKAIFSTERISSCVFICKKKKHMSI